MFRLNKPTSGSLFLCFAKVITIIIIIDIKDWTLWSVPSPELQLLAPTLLGSSNCSPSLWSVAVWFQRDSVLWHSLEVRKSRHRSALPANPTSSRPRSWSVGNATLVVAERSGWRRVLSASKPRPSAKEAHPYRKRACLEALRLATTKLTQRGTGSPAPQNRDLRLRKHTATENGHVWRPWG